MRRFTIVLSVVLLLSLTMLAGSLPASAKPGSGNSPNAKLCQKGGYATLATSEDPHTAFPTEEACVSYAAKGGIVVPLQTVTGRIIIPAGHTATMSGRFWGGSTLRVTYQTSTGASGPLGEGNSNSGAFGPVTIGPFAHAVALTIVVDDLGWIGFYGACGQFTSEGNHALVVATATGYAVSINDGQANCATAGSADVPPAIGQGDAELTITLAPAV